MFVKFNRPTHQRKAGGGYQVLWETWADDAETFPICPNPSNPPVWPGILFRLKALRPSATPGSVQLDWYTMVKGEPDVTATVWNPDEVRRNRTTFDYIVDNGLYYTEGLAAAFARADAAVAQVVAEDGGDTARAMQAMLKVVEFPIDAVEIKGIWVPLKDIPKGQRDDDVYVEKYALVSLHIITKELPQWFWATWLNKNVLGRCDYYGCRDDFGARPEFTPQHEETNYPYPGGALTTELKAMMRRNRLDKAFRNYRLVGTQTSFVDVSGEPVLMSNTINEQYELQTASCITCHARAAVDSYGAPLDVLSDTAQDEDPPSGDEFVTDNGVPDPSWFWNTESDYDFFSSNTDVTSLKALQIDFNWGIIRATSVDNCQE